MKYINYIFEAIDTSNMYSIPKKEDKTWKKPKVKKKKRKERNTKRIPKKYTVYIKSKWWKIRKNDYYRKNKKVCQACFTTKYIDLHHMIYGDYGSEEDAHLVTLCRDCHTEFHELFGVKQNMLQETSQFIIEKQETEELKTICNL